MRISAVICELNPFHNGHEFVFKKAKEGADVLIAVMSGNFVQRGECALFDKYARAEAALMCGADLVVELPFPWCAAPAEFFARGGVSLAMEMGADRIVFGSECGDISTIEKAALLSDSEEFKKAIEAEYTEEKGFAEAREAVFKRMAPDCAHVFSSANDMLAAEYLKSGKKLGFKGEFEAVLRLGGAGYRSASDIRRLVAKKSPVGAFEAVPKKLRTLYYKLLEEGSFARLERLFDIEFCAARLSLFKEGCFDSESGIVSRLEKASRDACDGAEMFALSATKKYTKARFLRAALFALLGVKKKDLEALPTSAFVLGFNEKGREVLSLLRKKEGIDFVTKPADATEDLALCQSADRLYTMLVEKPKKSGHFTTQKPVIFQQIH